MKTFTRIVILFIFLWGATFSSWAQKGQAGERGAVSDTLVIDPQVFNADGIDMPSKPAFVPQPNRALWYSVLFPGLGQVYNRKYWKLPILYGGFAATVYALNWNGQYLKEYSQAYMDIMSDDPLANSYVDLIGRPQAEILANKSRYSDLLKRRKDYFRRNRDLSIIGMVGVYILGVVDAYIDAQLFSFDISPDLSMQWEPTIIPASGNDNHSIGLQVGLKF